MKKQKIIDFIAQETGVKKTDIEKILKAFNKFVIRTLKEENKLQITGLGTWKVFNRKKFTNPVTGKTMEQESLYVTFSQSQHMKNNLNK